MGLSTESARPCLGHKVRVGIPWIDRVGKGVGAEGAA